MIDGENACFVYRKNIIFINEKKIINTVFHELGHAKSKQAPSLLLNLIAKKYGKYYPYLFLAALLVPKHKKENLNPSEKFDNKVITAIPALTVLGGMPLLVEEAKASIYGKEFAKQVLKPELVKKVAKSYKKAYLSYLGVVTITFIAYKAIILAKDKADTGIRDYFKNKQSV